MKSFARLVMSLCRELAFGKKPHIWGGGARHLFCSFRPPVLGPSIRVGRDLPGDRVTTFRGGSRIDFGGIEMKVVLPPPAPSPPPVLLPPPGAPAGAEVE